MSETRDEARVNEARSLILLALGEASAIFMSNPQPGTKQIMPCEKLVQIADELANQIIYGSIYQDDN